MRYPQAMNARRTRVAKVTPLPAPVGGWDAVSALADMPLNRAIVLDNWFPTPTDIRVRRGHVLHASGLGEADDPVESLMVYHSLTGADQMFAACGGFIYDVSDDGPVDDAVAGSFANSRHQYVNYTVPGGHYLIVVNGADAIQAYNGSVWSAPAITGVNATVIQVNIHKNRLWLIPDNSMSAWYLGTLAIAGAAAEFPLGGLFNKGGYLMAMATWTLDAGDGVDDLAIFITSEGQVAVYQGTDPSDSDTWALVGVYDLGKPLGRRCFLRIAADVALVNEDGVLPLSQALRQDRGAAATVAITQRINNAMNEAARLYAGHFGWEMIAYPRGTMALLNVPIAESETQHQYVMNTLTGAWCRFTGMNANCWAVFEDDIYFGGNQASVLKADTGANDLAQPIDAIGQTAFHYYNYRGLKEWTLMQVLLTTSSASALSIGMATDFRSNANLGTPTAGEIAASLWDQAVFDSSVFGEAFTSTANWTMPNALGMCASVNFRAITGESNLGVWGTGLWGSALWGTPVVDDIILRLNGFHALWAPGEVL